MESFHGERIYCPDTGQDCLSKLGYYFINTSHYKYSHYQQHYKISLSVFVNILCCKVCFVWCCVSLSLKFSGIIPSNIFAVSLPSPSETPIARMSDDSVLCCRLARICNLLLLLLLAGFGCLTFKFTFLFFFSQQSLLCCLFLLVKFLFELLYFSNLEVVFFLHSISPWIMTIRGFHLHPWEYLNTLKAYLSPLSANSIIFAISLSVSIHWFSSWTTSSSLFVYFCLDAKYCDFYIVEGLIVWHAFEYCRHLFWGVAE